MIYFMRPEFLVTLKHQRASLIREVASATDHVEVLAPDLLTRQKRNHKPIDHRNTKLLQQVKREGWPAGSRPVKEADLRIQAQRVESTYDFGENYAIHVTEKCIHRIPWRAPAPSLEKELRAAYSQMDSQAVEVPAGSVPFDASYGVSVIDAC